MCVNLFRLSTREKWASQDWQFPLKVIPLDLEVLLDMLPSSSVDNNAMRFSRGMKMHLKILGLFPWTAARESTTFRPPRWRLLLSAICFFLPQYQLIKKMLFFQSTSWERLWVIRWRERRCLEWTLIDKGILADRIARLVANVVKIANSMIFLGVYTKRSLNIAWEGFPLQWSIRAK